MNEQKTIQIFVFSFNRGELLENCVESAIHCFGEKAEINIYDDHSDDESTKQILTKLSKMGVSILTPNQVSRDSKSQSRGGLYKNMRDVINYYINCSKYKYTIFAQDDMQFVRHFLEDDIDYLDEAFNLYPQMVFIYPVFYRGDSHSKLKKMTSSSKVSLYFRKKGSTFTGFSAVFLARTDRLLNRGWKMPDSEAAASKLAAKHNGPMGVHSFPFLAYMPAPKTYRNKKDTLTHKYWNKTKNGCFPINYLSSKSVKEMKNQYPNKFPVAEDFLVSPSFGSHPWPVYRMQHAPQWLRFLDRLEIKLYRLYNSFFNYFSKNER